MKQEFVTLPREVVEQALEAFMRGCPPDCKDGMTDSGGVHPWGEAALIQCPSCRAVEVLRAALDQQQNHVPDAGNMVPAGWKLVPVEPTDDMLYDIQEFSHILPPRGKRIWAHMLAAAPQPPTTEDSSVVRPQVEQPAMTPIAQRKLEDLMASGYTISGYSVYHEQKHQHGFVNGAGLVGWWKPDGVEYPQPQGEQEPVAGVVIRDGLPCLLQDRHIKSTDHRVYTHPQNLHCKSNQKRLATLWGYVKAEPLTDEQIAAATGAKPGTPMWLVAVAFARAIEAAHNIK